MVTGSLLRKWRPTHRGLTNMELFLTIPTLQDHQPKISTTFSSHQARYALSTLHLNQGSLWQLRGLELGCGPAAQLCC